MTTQEICGKPAALRPTSGEASADGLWSRLVLRALRDIQCGALRLHLPNGRSLEVTGPAAGPRAEVTVRRTRALRRLVLRGDVGFGEAYVDGDWDCPDLATLFEFAALNRQAISDRFDPPAGLRLFGRAMHALQANTLRGSRRNIAAHYDLGNDFYAHWLDPTMTYSAGLFTAEDNDLERAQQRKYRRICQELALSPGDHVLEVGCGWGGFAALAAREFGVRVTGITLSREQLAYGRKHIAEQGLGEAVRLQLKDYRDLSGQFDHIVSIEMVEAVGERYWPTYFDTLSRCLRVNGRAVLQSILISPALFPGYRRSPDFIQRHVFPGGMLPTAQILRQHAETSGLSTTNEVFFGADYARTLADWRTRFESCFENLRGLGFDDRFRRLWHYYLGYCEGGFRGGAIDVGQVTLTRRA